MSTSPEPTAMPAPRSSFPNATSTSTSAVPSATGDDVLEAVARQLEVVTILHDRAERVVRGTHVEVALAEDTERRDPIEGLGHARGLREVELDEAG